MVTLQGIIRVMNPKLTTREVKDIAVTIVGSIEGLVVFVGHRRPWAKSIKAVRRYVMNSCLNLVRTGERFER
jgi:hypothetical protein